MKVLWLIRGLGPGGAERLLVAHARAGSPDFTYEAAYEVAAKDQLVPELEDAGVVVHRLPGGLKSPMALRHLVRERKVDLVHSHSPSMAAVARVMLRAAPGGTRPYLVYTEHNRWDAYRTPTRLANALTFPLEHRVLSVSDEARSSVFGPLRRRVETLHHGIDPEPVRAAAGDRAATRAALGIGPDTFMGVQVANYRREKGHDVMVETARLLRDAGDDIKIVMVGQGPLMEQTREAVAQAGVGDMVSMLGFRDDVPALLAAADALVLSSDHEGLPVAMMEAFALGTPMISTSVGGIPEAVTDGVEGLLVPPRDPQALAAALRRAAGDPELRRSLAAGAAARSADFDPRSATARIEGVYRSLLG